MPTWGDPAWLFHPLLAYELWPSFHKTKACTRSASCRQAAPTSPCGLCFPGRTGELNCKRHHFLSPTTFLPWLTRPVRNPPVNTCSSSASSQRLGPDGPAGTLVQFSSVAQSCLTLCNPMDCKASLPSPTPGFCSNSCPLCQ